MVDDRICWMSRIRWVRTKMLMIRPDLIFVMAKVNREGKLIFRTSGEDLQG